MDFVDPTYPQIFITETNIYYVDNPTDIKIFIKLIEIIKIMCININSYINPYINIFIKKLDDYLLLSEVNIYILINIIQNINLFLENILKWMYNIITKPLYNYLHIICLNTESLSILAEKIYKTLIFPECPICFESISDTNIFCCESSDTSKEKYKHTFHVSCIYEYCKLKKKDFPCPICRRQCLYSHLETKCTNIQDTFQDKLLKMKNHRDIFEKNILELVT